MLGPFTIETRPFSAFGAPRNQRRRCRFSHVSARPKAYKQNAEAMEAFKKNFPARVAEVRAKLAPGTPIEVWCQDEMRVGQKNKLTYRWARKGSRPRAIHDQRTQSTYLFGAVCPERMGGRRRGNAGGV